MNYDELIAEYDVDAPAEWTKCVSEVRVIADLVATELSEFDVTAQSGSFPNPDSNDTVWSATVTLRAFVPREEGEELYDDAGSFYVYVTSFVTSYDGGLFSQVRLRPVGSVDLGVEATFPGSVSARGVMRTVRRLVGFLDSVVEEAI